MFSMDDLNLLEAKSLTLLDPIFDYAAREAAELLKLAGQLNSTAAYRILRAQAAGVRYEALAQRIAELADWAVDEVEQIFTDAAKKFYEGDRERLQAAAPPFKDNFVAQRIAQAKVALATEELRTATQTIGFLDAQGRALPLREFYVNTVDYVFHNVVNGSMSLDMAVRIATDRMVGTDQVPGGIQTIDYASGVHTSTEAAVRRAILGGLALMVEEISEYNHNAMGANGWEITAHANSAPDHEPIQGLQLADAEYKRLITDDPSVREIGQFHCRHLRFSVIIGVTPPMHTPEYLQQLKDENAAGVTIDGKHYTGYKATQRRADLERNIRRWEKRRIVAEGSEAETKRCNARVSLARQRYAEFCKKSGLRQRPDRLFVSGWGRKYGAQVAAVTRLRNTSLKDGGSGILKVTDQAIERVKAVETNLLGKGGAAALQNAMRDVLRRVKDQPPGTEAAAAYTMDGKKLGDYIGKPGRVNVPRFPDPYIAIHNHPSGGTFSHTDIYRFIDDKNLYLSAVVGNNGTGYIMEKTTAYSEVGSQWHYERIAQKYPDCATRRPNVAAERYMEFIDELLKGLKRYGCRLYTE